MTHVRTSPFYPQSNGKQERVQGLIKQECIRPKCPASLSEAKRFVNEYVGYYITNRLHSAIGYISPKSMLEGCPFLGEPIQKSSEFSNFG